MLMIYGSSDDLVEIEGHLREELNADDVLITIGWPNGVPAEDRDPAGIRIRMTYSKEVSGCWEATLGMIDEDVPCPWAVSAKLEGYTVRVSVECPEGTPVSWEIFT